MKGLSKELRDSGKDSEKNLMDSIERSVSKMIRKSEDAIVQRVSEQTKVTKL